RFEARRGAHRGSATAPAGPRPGGELRGGTAGPGCGRGGRRQRLGHGRGGGPRRPLFHRRRRRSLGRGRPRGARGRGSAGPGRGTGRDGGAGPRLRSAERGGIERGRDPRPQGSPRCRGTSGLHGLLGLARPRPPRFGGPTFQPGPPRPKKGKHPGFPPPLPRSGHGMPAENGDMMTRTARRVHLLGVGGTGMGAFAYLLQQAGYEVTGSDQNLYPPMSEMLERWGIPALSPYDPANLDRARPDLVVVG